MGSNLFDSYNGEDSFEIAEGWKRDECDFWRNAPDDTVSFWVNKWGDSV